MDIRRLISCLIILIQVAHAKRCIMYLTGQHNVVPEPSLVSNVTHVALAFMPSSAFNVPNASSWPLFTTVEDVRAKFPETTAVMIAIGGWGDTDGFSVAAATEKSRKLFALNVKAMLQRTGADGVDIDWEYPGGNGEDYKTVPNTRKSWEIEAYPKLISEIRNALGPDKLISAAVPGLRRDMIAFTRETVPVLNELLDFFNIMTYDLMNRRDNVTKHHTGLQLSLDGIHTYLENGVLHEKANLGFAFYVKWFKTSSQGGCSVNPVGCKTVLMEDPVTGADLGQTGAFSWHDEIPPALAQSFAKASEHGRYDTKGGGYYYWDQVEDIFWTWDTTDAISKKIPLIVDKSQLGGVFAWGLGEDAPRFDHLRTLTHSLKEGSQGLRLQMSDGLTDGLPLSEEHWREEL